MAHMVKDHQYISIHGLVYACAMPQHHRDEPNRSTLDLDSRQKRQIDVSVTEMNSTAQYIDIIDYVNVVYNIYAQYRSVRSTRTRA